MLRAPAKSHRREPRQERAQLTVEAIVEAAAQVLEAKGYEGATTQLIAERAGVSIGTLYEYFADKEALSLAVLRRCMAHKLDRLRQESAAVAALPLAAAVRRLLEVFLQQMARQHDLTRVLLGRAVYVPFAQEPSDIAAGFVALLTDFLTARRHEIRPVEIELAIFVLLNSLDAILDAVVLERPEYMGDPRLLAELSLLFTNYLLPR